MATLFKEVSYSLSKLIHDIQMGEIGLPEIQRPFVWGNNKVRDLFDSMYKGFPVGYLLFWANGVGNGHRQIGTGDKQKVARLLIVDGQQRLTSLYAVLNGVPVLKEDYTENRINIAFRPLDQKFVVTDAAIRKNPEYIPDISVLWSQDISRRQYEKKFFERLRLAREVSEEEEYNLSEAIDQLYDLQNYPFTALELSTTVDEEQVAEVFVRINSQGKTLNQADFILTLMSVFWDQGRKKLEIFCRDALVPDTTKASPYNYYSTPSPDQLLRVSIALGFRRARLRYAYSILRGKDLETEEFSEERREQQFKKLETSQAKTLDLQNWHDYFKALALAGYRGEKMISSQNALLYTYAFYLIGKYDFDLDEYILRNVIARWFFMVALTSRYSGSFESQMEQDLGRLGDISEGSDFVSLLDRIIEDNLTSDYWDITLPNDLETSSSRSPSLFAYYSALNLLDANVLFSKMKVKDLVDDTIRAKKSPVERHHLFPKGYLRTLEITRTRDTNQIANFALVEWADNIKISDKPPQEYYDEYVKRFSDDELKNMLFWHALPDGWEQMEYWEFVENRRKKIASVIKAGFIELEKKTKSDHA